MFLVDIIDKVKVNSQALISKILLAVILSCLSACAYQEYEPQAITTNQAISDLLARDIGEPGFKQFMQENGVRSWPIRQWKFEGLYLTALYFNPQIQADFAKFKFNEAQARTILQRQNPVLNLPLEHHSETGGDLSPWFIGVIFDFIYERPAKLRAKQDKAEAEIQAALIDISKSVWKLRSDVKQAWISYTSAVSLDNFIKDELNLLEESLVILKKQHELGQTSYFEVSNTRLELQRLKLESSHHQSVISDGYHDLLALLGLSPEKLQTYEFVPASDMALPEPDDISQLSIQNIALHERYDVRQALFEYQAVEATLRLEIEKQYPDITLSPGFIFDQNDNIWALAASWVLPVFHHNQAQIDEALAKRLLLQKQFQVLQSQLIHELAKKRQHFIALVNALNQAEVLVSELRDREDVYQKQYDSGYTGEMDLLRSRLETLRAERALFEIRVSVLNSLARLETLIQTPLQDELDAQQIIQSLFSLNNETAPGN